MTDKPSVLFVRVHDSARPPMAARWLRHLAGDRVEIRLPPPRTARDEWHRAAQQIHAARVTTSPLARPAGSPPTTATPTES